MQTMACVHPLSLMVATKTLLSQLRFWWSELPFPSLSSAVSFQNGVKIFEGTPVPVFSERDVFKYLDLPYREPTERDWD